MRNIRRKKIEEAKKKARIYVNVLKNKGLSIQSAFLYGSYATGKFYNDSDIDICIVSPKFNTNSDKDRLFLWQQRRTIDFRIEPIGFNLQNFRDTNPLVYEIKKNGIKII